MIGNLVAALPAEKQKSNQEGVSIVRFILIEPRQQSELTDIIDRPCSL